MIYCRRAIGETVRTHLVEFDVVEHDIVELDGLPWIAEHERGLVKRQIPWRTIVSQALVLGQLYLTVEEVTLKIAIGLCVALVHLQALVLVRKEAIALNGVDASNVLAGVDLRDGE